MPKILLVLLGCVVFLTNGIPYASAQSTADPREIKRIGNGTARDVAWNPDGKQVAIGGSLGIWLYASNLKPIKHFDSNDAEIWFLAWSPNGQQIASIDRTFALQVWNINDGKKISLASGNNINLTYSSDGSRLAVLNKERQINIWDTQTLALISTLHVEGDVHSMAWPPGDLTRLAVGGWQEQKTQNGEPFRTVYLQIIDPLNNKVLQTFTPPKIEDLSPAEDMTNSSYVNGLRWTDQAELTAKLFMCFGNDTPHFLAIWNTTTNKLNPIDIFMACGSRLTGISFSPDDKNYALSIQNCGAYVDSRSSAMLQINCCHYLDAGSEPIARAAWSPDDQLILVITGKGLIELVDLTQVDPQGGPITASIVVHTFENTPAFIYWSGSRILYRQYNYMLGSWHLTSINISDLLTQELLQTIKPSSDPSFIYPAFSPNGGSIAAIGEANGSAIFDVKTGKTVAKLENLMASDNDPGGQVYINAFYWSADSKAVATQFAQSIYIWDATSGKVILKQKLDNHRYQFSWSPDSKLILVNPAYFEREQVPFVIDVTTGQTKFSLEGVTAEANATFTWGPAGRGIAAITKDNVIRIWNTASGKLLQMLPGYWLQWSPNGAWLAINNKIHQIEFYNTATGKIAITLEDQKGFSVSMAFSPDSGHIATTSADGRILVWEVGTGQLSFTLSGHRGSTTWLKWKPDGTQLLSASSDGTLRLWDTHIP